MKKRIGIRVNANKKIGIGHLMRCRSISECLNTQGIETVFFISEDSDILAFQGLVYEIVKHDKFKDIIISSAINLLIVDMYDVSEQSLREWDSIVPVVYIDDIHVLVSYPVSMIINYNFEANEELYISCKKDAKLLIGANFFPAREEFRNKKKSIKNDISSVLLTSGATDPNHIMYRLLELYCGENPDILFYVLIGLFYEDIYINEIIELSQKYHNIKLLNWGQNMADLFIKMDVVISPGSTTVFEALTVGTPCISFSFADNQYGQCIAMNERGICPYVGNTNDPLFDEKSIELFNKIKRYSEREGFYKQYSKMFDGLGTQRIVQEIMLLL